jgi:hypothetical protein
MKINLLIEQPNILSGYLNISPVLINEKILKGQPDKLDDFVEDNECKEIIASYITDYYPSSKIGPMIDHWIAKLRHGGQLIMEGIDLEEISRGFLSHQLKSNTTSSNLQNMNDVLYGDEKLKKQSMLTCGDLAGALKQCGLKIIRSSINNYRYSITAIRP